MPLSDPMALAQLSRGSERFRCNVGFPSYRRSAKSPKLEALLSYGPDLSMLFRRSAGLSIRS